jgi:hypothetical protein
MRFRVCLLIRKSKLEADRPKPGGSSTKKGCRSERPLLDVPQAAEEVDQPAVLAPVQADRQRVDREVPAIQVLLDRRKLNRRERPRRLVVFEPGRGDVEFDPVRERDHGGAELLVRLHPAAELLHEHAREGDAVALDHDVHVQVRHAQEKVPHDAAHKVHGKSRLIGHVADGPERIADLRRYPFIEQARTFFDGRWPSRRGAAILPAVFAERRRRSDA